MSQPQDPHTPSWAKEPDPQQPVTWGQQPPPPQQAPGYGYPPPPQPPAGFPPPPGQPGPAWVPPQPQPPKNRGKLAALGCGGLLLFGLIVGGIASIANSNTDTTTASSSSDATSDTTPDSPPVAEQLRDLDIADGHAGGSRTTYSKAFATLSGRCTEQGVGLGNEVGATLKLLQKAGIQDENRLTVMQHVADSIPPGQKMRFADVAGAYVTLREGG